MRTIWDGKVRTVTATITQLLSSVNCTMYRQAFWGVNRGGCINLRHHIYSDRDVLTFGMIAGVGMHPNKKKKKPESTRTFKRRVGWRGEGKKAHRPAYYGLVTNKLRTISAGETHPLRSEFRNRRIDTRTHSGFTVVRLHEYLLSFIPTAIRTHNQQAGRQTQHSTARDGDAGRSRRG